MSLFRKSNEEKFLDYICNIDRGEFHKEIFQTYRKYMSMREIWAHEKLEPNDIYYKIKKGEMISKKDITIMQDAAKKNKIGENDPVYRICIDTLTVMHKLGIEISGEGGTAKRKIRYVSISSLDKKNLEENMKKILNISITVDEAIKNQNQIDALVNKPTVSALKMQFRKYVYFLESVEKMLEAEDDGAAINDYKASYSKNKRLLTIAKELNDYFYGPNNFYRKGAREVVNNHKDIFDLVLKCDSEKHRTLVIKKSRKGLLNDMEYKQKLDDLWALAEDAFGKNDKLVKKIPLLEIFVI